MSSSANDLLDKCPRRLFRIEYRLLGYFAKKNSLPPLPKTKQKKNTQKHTLEKIIIPKISVKRQPVIFDIMWWRYLMSVKKISVWRLCLKTKSKWRWKGGLLEIKIRWPTF